VSSTSPENLKQNLLLAALAPKEYARLVDDLELVSLARGLVLYEPGDKPDYVYFPTTCILSQIFTTANGSSAELAMTGYEGLVGISLILGDEFIRHRVDVQSPGNAYRLRVEVMQWELDQGRTLQRIALWYTQSLMAQMAQSVVCNRYHTVDQQVCRWLLLFLDRVSGSEIVITQERISQMLGVRREGVTEVAVKLQSVGLILYSRGRITVIDRPGLEARACECYAAASREQVHPYRPAPESRFKDRVRSNPATLRRRAEARLRRASPTAPEVGFNSARLLHELQVHQIELEMQKEELLCAYGESDALRERYADIYDFSPASYFTLDRHGTILELNLAGAILLGIKRSQKNRYFFSTSVRAEDADVFKQFVADVLKKKGKRRCEIALQASKYRGEAIIRIEAVPDENMQECRMVVIDITAEKRAEKRLLERCEQQRALIDNLPFNAWLKDAPSRYLAANRSLAVDHRMPSSRDLVGRSDFATNSHKMPEPYYAEHQAALSSDTNRNGGQIIEIHGKNRWFEIVKSPFAVNHQPVATMGFSEGITERHLFPHGLSESERQQRIFLESLPLGVTITQDGILKYINPKISELFGNSAYGYVGGPFLRFVYEEDRPKALAGHDQRMRGESAPLQSELRFVAPSGQVLHCRCYFNPITWSGRPASLAILEYVSAKKWLQTDLQS